MSLVNPVPVSQSGPKSLSFSTTFEYFWESKLVIYVKLFAEDTCMVTVVFYLIVDEFDEKLAIKFILKLN